MNIVHIQTGLPTSGNAPYRLHKVLLEEGFGSSMLMLTSSRPIDKFLRNVNNPFKNIKIYTERRIESLLLRKQIKGTYLFSYPLMGYNLSRDSAILNADLIILHWSIGGLLNFDGYKRLLKLGKPILFFLHDMWTITGGCHHSFECEKYKTHCGCCPMFSTSKVKDLAYKQFEKKKALFDAFDNVSFAAPSLWLFQCMMEASLTKNKQLFHLPNVINRDVFKPFDKKVAKAILNIDPSKKVITFGAKTGTSSKFKGWSYLKDALQILKESSPKTDYIALIFGSEYDQETDNCVPYETIFTGLIFDDHTLNIIYNATDVFVTPTLADNFPSTVLESQSCNTPVVAFNVGGLPDLIDHKENGYLAQYKDHVDLYNGIKFCLENNIKGYLKDELSPETVFEKYKSVFVKLTEE